MRRSSLSLFVLRERRVPVKPSPRNCTADEVSSKIRRALNRRQKQWIHPSYLICCRRKDAARKNATARCGATFRDLSRITLTTRADRVSEKGRSPASRGRNKTCSWKLRSGGAPGRKPVKKTSLNHRAATVSQQLSLRRHPCAKVEAVCAK